MTGPARTLPMRFDPLAAEVVDDPYPTYARLRAAGAVGRAGPGMWAVTRHAEVAALLRDERLGHRFGDEFRRPFTTADGPANALLQGIVSSLEPPAHTRIRHLLSKAMAPAVIRDLKSYVEGEVDRLLGTAFERGSFDAVAEFSLPLQVSVGCHLLGIDGPDRDEIWPRAVSLGRAFIPFAPGEAATADDDAVAWLRDYVAGLLVTRRRRPGNDLVSRMLTVEHHGDRLTDAELIDNAIFLFFAGFETSMYLVGLTLALLADHPDQFRRVAQDRALIPTAVEEFLRFDAPIQWMARIALAPLVVGDTSIRAGRVVLLLLACANRDPAQFADPDRVDVGRRPNPHLSFGGGIHHCLGVNLARTQGAILVDRLVTRCARLAPAGLARRRVHPNLRGFDQLPLAIGPR